MPGKEKEASTERVARARGRLRPLVLAALLAVLTTLALAGPALADPWPSDNPPARLSVQHQGPSHSGGGHGAFTAARAYS